jgi:hypothetical protein
MMDTQRLLKKMQYENVIDVEMHTTPRASVFELPLVYVPALLLVNAKQDMSHSTISAPRYRQLVMRLLSNVQNCK